MSLEIDDSGTDAAEIDFDVARVITGGGEPDLGGIGAESDMIPAQNLEV